MIAIHLPIRQRGRVYETACGTTSRLVAEGADAVTCPACREVIARRQSARPGHFAGCTAGIGELGRIWIDQSTNIYCPCDRAVLKGGR